MLELQELRRVFGDVVALDGLSFDVRRGELCGFLGPNGAGKTTAMRAVLGVTRLDGGEVRWDGVPITADVRAGTGYLPEERGLYAKMPIGEQLVYFARLHGLDRTTANARVEVLLERLGLAERIGDATEALSLGNQQRVQFAAALVHEPELLVLDEPFSGLDPLAVDMMSALLREQAERGAAVVFSSHQLDLVEDLCSTVAIVNGGRTVLHGDVAELKSRGPTRLRVVVDGPERWIASIPPEARVVARDGDEFTLVLDDDVDPVGVLQHARQSGPVVRMSLEQPRLSELFRDAVGEPV
ncbi:ABC transporter ATP-binding protein [Egicoccus halophilus]|uniref:ABC transporter ATP-binding protein n=1 Tax=Egicoccus halophilus TaxID=1670830 RepID=A0A8J3AFT8_9ACTN|nr:ATP-binding cassette domain-containing protein [Egicoccus halophilus]GGI08286.1 ABC transporter ATP-binding protein [Egicoccus halophilus]